MKFFITLAAVVAIAVAVPVHRELVSPGIAGPAPIVDENGSPIAIGPAIIDFSPISVGPAIVDLNPISVGPAIVEANPIAVGPAIIDFPLPDGGVSAEEPAIVVPMPVVMPSPVVPSPVVVGDIPAGSSALVQIIVNVNQQESAPAVVPTPVEAPVIDEVYVPGPVNVVDHVIAPEPVIDPVVVLEPAIPGPVNVVDNVEAPVVPAPVVIGTPALPEVVIPEPVIVGTPIIPAPAVVLPEQLN